MNNTHFSAFEEKVRQAIHTPDPNPEFAGALWERVIAQPQRQPFWGKRIHANILGPVWALTAGILLVLITAVTLVGPQRVLAALQGVLGYIPGVGFVSTENAAAMREPVEVIQNGQVFRVEQLLSSNNETVLVLRLQGFAANQNIGLDDGISLEMADGNAIFPHSVAVDGTITPGEYTSVYKFSPLPIGTNQITVAWESPSTAQPGELAKWQVPVTLFPVSDPEVVQLLPSSYEPEAVSTSHLGITFEVDQVSSNPTNTAVRLQMKFPQEFDFASPDAVLLIDEMGKTYQNQKGQVHFEDNGQPYRILTTPGPTPQVYKNLHETLDFPGVNTATKQLTLQVEQVNFRASPSTTISIDLGAHPSVGDNWPINQVFTVGELSLRINRARLVTLDKDTLGSRGQTWVGLVLDVDPVVPDQIRLTQIWLSVLGSQEVYEQDTSTWTAAWLPDQVPSGTIDLNLDSIQGILSGDWKIQWENQKP